MNEREIAERGAEFKSRVRSLFGFLTTDFGFEAAQDESGASAHRLSFRNVPRGQLIEVVNAFHGIDYGFEVSVYPIAGPRPADGRIMVYYKLKEEQDAGFAFLAEAAQALRRWLQAGPGA